MNNTILAVETWKEGLLLGNHLFATQNTQPQTSSLPGKQTILYKWQCLLQNDSLTIEMVQYLPYLILDSGYKYLYTLWETMKRTLEFCLFLRNPVEFKTIGDSL